MKKVGFSFKCLLMIRIVRRVRRGIGLVMILKATLLLIKLYVALRGNSSD